MSELFRLISISLVLIFVENTVFTRAIDTSTLISVSRNRKNIFGFGLCVVYFSVVTGFLGFFADKFFLESGINNEQTYIYQPFVYVAILGVVYIITLLILWKFFYKNFLVKREDRTQYSFMQYKHLDDVPSTLNNSHASFVLLYRSHKVSPSLYY